jgi:hypothetical protein
VSAAGHLLFVWSTSGYALREAAGEPPAAGDEVEVDGRTLVVTRIGPSPFPHDDRPCAYLAGKG